MPAVKPAGPPPTMMSWYWLLVVDCSLTAHLQGRLYRVAHHPDIKVSCYAQFAVYYEEWRSDRLREHPVDYVRGHTAFRGSGHVVKTQADSLAESGPYLFLCRLPVFIQRPVYTAPGVAL